MSKNFKLAKFYSREIDIESQTVVLRKFGKRFFESTTRDGDGYLHPTQIVVNMGGKIYLIDADGLTELEGEATGRGVSIYRQYGDEDGGHYEVHEQFHKGLLFKEVRKIGYTDLPKTKEEVENWEFPLILDEDVPEEAIKHKDLWRD